MLLVMKPADTKKRSMVGTSERVTKASTSFVRSFDPGVFLRRSTNSLVMFLNTR